MPLNLLRNFSYVIHAATEASFKLDIEKPINIFETLINGTKIVLEFAKLKNVKYFLFKRSVAVYGAKPSSIENILEDYLGAPNVSGSTSVYDEGKRMAEVLCAVFNKHYSLTVKIA